MFFAIIISAVVSFLLFPVSNYFRLTIYILILAINKGDLSMASNFKIFSHRNRDSLHLQMHGDFDGNSAHEVISALKKHETEHIQVFIDTNDLKNIHSFGINVFQKHINALERKSNHLVFLGKNKHSFSHNLSF